ncbi:LLM class flavin-dependent oxidoreductase [Streptomyces sp. NBC_01190]|uniref:LLM class flavin-dependent oxidoreductase n=1 Tax=Streptomyces sp. NBC_01190 TaxID=2903767 RepID=UPI003868164F|nr:LLM class flavin-dependent oxidoreductase [Streptomyces sp. NBC_01190]
MASIRRIAVRAGLPAATALGDRFPSVRFVTRVVSPNFRHPVTLAKDLMTLDDVSGGRITLGIAFVDFAGRHQEAGITEIVIHWPIPDSYFAVDHGVFERIATEAPAQLG